MKLIPLASAGRHSSSSSSGGRSTTMRPSTPAARASSRKRAHAVAVDRVVIAHQHQGRIPVRAAEAADQAEHVAETRARLERPQRRGLDRRAVGHRIGERHAELDHVGAGLRQPFEDRPRRGGVGIAGGDEGDEARSPFARQMRETAADASRIGRRRRGAGRGLQRAHSLTPSASATVKMSLSPRPQKFDHDEMIPRQVAGDPRHIGERVRRFERRDDALGLGAQAERRQAPPRRSPIRR